MNSTYGAQQKSGLNCKVPASQLSLQTCCDRHFSFCLRNGFGGCCGVDNPVDAAENALALWWSRLMYRGQLLAMFFFFFWSTTLLFHFTALLDFRFLQSNMQLLQSLRSVFTADAPQCSYLQLHNWAELVRVGPFSCLKMSPVCVTYQRTIRIRSFPFFPFLSKMAACVFQLHTRTILPLRNVAC